MRLVFLVGLLVIASSLKATSILTDKISLEGVVVSAATDSPLEYATVSAFSSDNRLVEGTITDDAGFFSLQLDRGVYTIKIEYLGFDTHEAQIELQSQTNLGTLSLATSRHTLDAVEVRAEKSQVNLHLDKKVFNIGQDALARGGSAISILENLPSINVSAEGAVSLRGNSGVRILINGRPSALANSNGLESIPAASIERVEIITNPSARYEASGSAGIINIILKKEVQRGYGGTVSANTGFRAEHRLNLNLNWRRNKYNAFFNGGARYSNYRGQGDFSRVNSLEGVIARQDQNYIMDRNDVSFNAYAGADINLSEKSTLTATYSIYDIVNTDTTYTDYSFADESDERTENWNQRLDYQEPGTYHQIDFVFAHDYSREGQKLTAYFRNDLWNEEESEAVQINQSFPNEVNLLQFRTGTLEGSRDHLLQVDYESPLGEFSRFEIGLRGETRIIEADYLAETFADNAWTALAGFDNALDYFERIGAAYFQYGYEKAGLGIQIGLRNEYTAVRVELENSPEEDIKKNYNRLFPSFSINYKFSEGLSTQLSYSRRLRRPSFWQLNPFRGINDPSSLFIGNPDMDPSFTDRVELNLLRQTKKITLNPAIYASRTTDYFEFVTEQEADNLFDFGTGTVVSMPFNLQEEYQYGVELNAGYRPVDAVNFNVDFNYFGYAQRGDLGDRNFDFDFATWSAGARLQLNLPGDLSFQSRFSYTGRYKTVQTVRQAQSFVTAAISKRWNDRITVSINVRSPRWWRSELFRPSFFQTEYGSWTRWRTGINLQYRFEKGAAASSRRGRGSIRG